MQQRRFTDRTDANKWAAKQRPPEVPLRDIVLGLRLVKRLEGHTRRPFAVLPWIAAVRALVLRSRSRAISQSEIGLNLLPGDVRAERQRACPVPEQALTPTPTRSPHSAIGMHARQRAPDPAPVPVRGIGEPAGARSGAPPPRRPASAPRRRPRPASPSRPPRPAPGRPRTCGVLF